MRDGKGGGELLLLLLPPSFKCHGMVEETGQDTLASSSATKVPTLEHDSDIIVHNLLESLV